MTRVEEATAKLMSPFATSKPSKPASTPEPEAVAVIPARGGSKRIPHKNIRKLGGRPLLAYTVSAALDSGLFERVVVSTDDAAIAAVARASGAEVLTRAAELSDDHTPTSLVTLGVVEQLGLGDARHVAQLLPNCPLRTAEDVRSSYTQFLAGEHEAQLSVTRYGWLNPWWAFTMDAQGPAQHLTPVFEAKLKARSQDLPTLYCPTGAVWWTTAASLRREKTFHTARRTGWELPWQRAVDIDDEDDWQLAELLLTRA